MVGHTTAAVAPAGHGTSLSGFRIRRPLRTATFGCPHTTWLKQTQQKQPQHIEVSKAFRLIERKADHLDMHSPCFTYEVRILHPLSSAMQIEVFNMATPQLLAKTLEKIRHGRGSRSDGLGAIYCRSYDGLGEAGRASRFIYELQDLSSWSKGLALGSQAADAVSS